MNDKAQEKYMEFQTLQQQLEQLQQYADEVQSKQMEFVQTKESLEELKHVEKGVEMFVPLGQGIFAKATLQDTNKFLVNVGAGVAVKKDINSCVDIIQKQVTEIKQVSSQLNENILKLNEKMNALMEEIRQL